ncbi:MAG: flagellar biosynthesis anti-sigma factor FlgM [Gammaproteobacteria bacterium]
MDIKINSAIAAIHNNSQSKQPATTDTQSAVVKDIRPARTSQADFIEITESANFMQALENKISDQPVIDSQRVRELKQLIETGELHVNPERIADKMIDMERIFDRSAV